MIKLAGGCVGGTLVGIVIGKTMSMDRAHMSWTSPLNPDDYKPIQKWDWNWDRRQPEALVKPSKIEAVPGVDVEDLPKSTATRHIILIRHGQYNLMGKNPDDKTLTDLGVRQAHLTGARLKELNLPISRLVYSTMIRATQTANCIMTHLDKIPDVESTDLLREGSPYPPEPPISSWRPERHQFHTDGARIEAAFRAYMHRAPPSQTEDSYELLVCHANVIRYFVCRALQFPPEGWLRMGLHNGSMTCMSIRPNGRVSIRQLGEVGYMPPDALSTT